jgi:hypothetical protein
LGMQRHGAIRTGWISAGDPEQRRFVKAEWDVLPAKNWSQLLRCDSGEFGVAVQDDIYKTTILISGQFQRPLRRQRRMTI